MFKFAIVFAAYLACAIAKPGDFAPAALAAAPAIAYANAPLYAAGGSSQIDVRHNYDGTLSSYTTAPFGYTAPYSSRYVAGTYAAGPAAFATPAKYVAPAGVAAPYIAPFAAHYAAPYAAYSAGIVTPFAAAQLVA